MIQEQDEDDRVRTNKQLLVTTWIQQLPHRSSYQMRHQSKIHKYINMNRTIYTHTHIDLQNDAGFFFLQVFPREICANLWRTEIKQQGSI